jgi:hypothetical protein
MSAKWDGTNLTKQILPLRKAPPSKVYYVFFAYIATSGYVTPTSHLYSTSFIELKDAPAGADHTAVSAFYKLPAVPSTTSMLLSSNKSNTFKLFSAANQSS